MSAAAVALNAVCTAVIVAMIAYDALTGAPAWATAFCMACLGFQLVFFFGALLRGGDR